MRSFLYTSIMLVVILCNCFSQQDTLKKKEEVILSSNLMDKAEGSRVEYRLKQIFKYTSRWERKELFRVGFTPTFLTIPGDTRVESPGLRLLLRYDRKIFSPQFAIGAEGVLRLYGVGNKGYDYRLTAGELGRQVHLFGSSWNHGSYFTNIFTTDLYFKFFYQQKRRLSLKASGNNFTSPYFSFKIKDAFAFTRERIFNISPPTSELGNGQLINITDDRRLMVRPAYYMIGWGVQRPLLGSLWAELQLGIGGRLPGVDTDFRHFHKDAVYEFNLFIGFDFSKRKRIKND
ncbi:hypothetical protein [Roseivirga sp. E12]|uniref:hypothetical protein n=1 Tax=Roseivirga sp. E12 TaxID=2819237 RepID=UPI001ABC5E2A|nr:hypothetical protein [Roseivirga sp. E12]MBO3700387.1 hypothetical protein [Roseivirga sp. E12]